ncbi:MAG: hypothetical protein AB7F19_05455 [Candidatus Babeliales bacterium]
MKFALYVCVGLNVMMIAQCMDCPITKRVQLAESNTGSREIAPLYQQMLLFPPAQRLVSILEARNPDAEPLFEGENGKKNLALIQSIGRNNARTKLALLASLFGALNAGVSTAALYLWGTVPQYPMTDLIPPNHLMNLHPCYRICRAYCVPASPDCTIDCDGPWDCSANNQSLNALGATALVSLSANGLVCVLGLLYAACTYTKGQNSEEKLKTLLQKLHDATEGLPQLQSIPSNSDNAIRDVLDKHIAHDMERADQDSINTQRNDLIALIKSTGSADAKWKLYAGLAALFGANLTKDLIGALLWGQDTFYPSTPLPEHNQSLPIIPCKQVCWHAGCCGTPDCIQPPCITVCGVDCVSEQKTTNAFGYTSICSILANTAGILTFGWLSFRSCRSSTKANKSLTQRLHELRQVIAHEK